MAQILALYTRRPDTQTEQKKYNIKNLGRKEWRKYNEDVTNNKRFSLLRATVKTKRENLHPADIYDDVKGVLRETVADRFA